MLTAKGCRGWFYQMSKFVNVGERRGHGFCKHWQIYYLSILGYSTFPPHFKNKSREKLRQFNSNKNNEIWPKIVISEIFSETIPNLSGLYSCIMVSRKAITKQIITKIRRHNVMPPGMVWYFSMSSITSTSVWKMKKKNSML